MRLGAVSRRHHDRMTRNFIQKRCVRRIAGRRGIRSTGQLFRGIGGP
jgi:hypothetical protein